MNPFDPAVDDLDLAQPNWTDAFLGVANNLSRELRVCLPCAVVKVRANQTVDLQPLIQAFYVADGKPSDLPIVGHVPVSMPMGADWSVKYPLAVGDTGFAVFADRSLDNWLAGDGSIVDSDSPRLHNLTDAIFVPGLVPRAKQTTDNTQDLVLRNGTAQVRLEKNGTFRIANQGQELVDLVGQLGEIAGTLVTALQNAQTPTMMGPQGFWAATQADLGLASSKLEALSAKLQTLKGK